ncbi:response regulator [Chloroflexota bacterium]
MIRIFVATEAGVVREGLKQIVAVNRDMVVAGEARNGQEVLDEISKSHYDVIVLDISMPGRSGLDVLKELKSQRTNLPVLILSAHPDEEYAMRAFRAGASGYLTTECTPDELITALRKVLRGGKYVSASLAERLAFDLEKGAEKPPHELLSDREHQVMCLIASGRTVSEIGDEISLSVKTISTYRSRVLEKLNLKNNAELARYYARFCATKAVQCKNCGQDNPQEARFCAYCGTALDAKSEFPLEPPEATTERASYWRKYKWVVVAFVIIAVVVGVIGWRIQQTSTTPAVLTEVELRYDDGVPLNYISPHWGGYIVSFSPPFTPFIINKIKICGVVIGTGWEGKDFKLQIWNKEQEVLHSASYPFTLFPHGVSPIEAKMPVQEGVQWIEVEVPNIEADTDFFVHIYVGTKKWEGIHLYADDSVTNKHSDITVAVADGVYQIRDTWPYPSNMWFADKSKVNWMIRVVGRSLE